MARLTDNSTMQRLFCSRLQERTVSTMIPRFWRWTDRKIIPLTLYPLVFVNICTYPVVADTFSEAGFLSFSLEMRHLLRAITPFQAS